MAYSDRPLAQVREYVTLLKECLAGDSVSFDGDFYRCSRFRLGVRLGERRPKVVVGALNPNMLSLAGEVADGVLLNYLPASHVGWSVEHVRAGEAAPGAAPGGDRRLRPRGRLRARGRDRPRPPRPVQPRWSTPTPPTSSGPASATRSRRSGSGTPPATATGRCAVSDAMVDAIDVMGDPDQVRAAVQAYTDAGVQVPVIMPLPWGPDRMAVVDATMRAVVGWRAPPVRSTHGPRAGVRGDGWWQRHRRSPGAAVRRRGAAGVVVADLGAAGAEAVAASLPDGRASPSPATSPTRPTTRCSSPPPSTFGPVDLYCSNAGIGTGAGIEGALADWQRVWEVNTLAHVLAARAVLPSMLARGRGLLSTASAAGLLVNLGDASYTAASTPPSASPSGCRSPTATGASACRACARWASTPTCCAGRPKAWRERWWPVPARS